MIGRCALNNMNMRNLRRSQEYQCVIIDLAMLGIVSKEEAEMLIGSGVPLNLRLPNGKNNMVSEENLVAPENRETNVTPETNGETGITKDPDPTENPVITEKPELTENTANSATSEGENTPSKDDDSEGKKGFKLFGGKGKE